MYAHVPFYLMNPVPSELSACLDFFIFASLICLVANGDFLQYIAVKYIINCIYINDSSTREKNLLVGVDGLYVSHKMVSLHAYISQEIQPTLLNSNDDIHMVRACTS